MLAMRSAITAFCAVMLIMAAASSAFEVCSELIAFPLTTHTFHWPIALVLLTLSKFDYLDTTLAAHTASAAQVNGR